MNPDNPPSYGKDDPMGGYQPAPSTGGGANVTVVTAQVATNMPNWGEYPVGNFQCPYCGNVITTLVRSKIGTMAILITLVLFLFIGVFALFILCIDSFNDVEHVCPVDGRVVGVYKRM